MKKISIILITLILLLNIFTIVALPHSNLTNTISDEITISQPLFKEQHDETYIILNETSFFINDPGQPMLPAISRSYCIPFGSTINDVHITYETLRYEITKQITKAPPRILHVGNKEKEITDTYQKYDACYSSNLYPSNPYMISQGSGLDGSEHVHFITIDVMVQYDSVEQVALVPQNITITIKFTQPEKKTSTIDNYDMVIITPQSYASGIKPLIVHKNAIGISTNLKTTEDIYQEYSGTDHPEQIKRFIRDAIETQGITNVLIVGGVQQVPMRTVYWDFGDGSEIDMLVDLYYSDIYNETGEFCSWDENKNGLFGEENDKVDFYPDVHLGRLSCDTENEVAIVVEKIIRYETETFGSEWFNNMILMAGDTFPEDRFPGAVGREGEAHTNEIMDIMDMFAHTVIWTSKGNFNKESINTEISDGAGFVFYSGHGFPNGICPEGGSSDRSIYYNSRDIKDLTNGFKLPIIFLTACSTAKLDFTVSEFLESYLPLSMINLLDSIPFLNLDRPIPCFAWRLVSHEDGGAIATIGSTHYIMSSGYDSGGCVNPPNFFFESYDQSIKLGEMHSSMINANIQLIPTDFLASYTIMEHILLGDPSLTVGGNP